tara:strand:+ start:35 stop:229 length:195 start_codon:yes stop_codon:yes gene_type:complete
MFPEVNHIMHSAILVVVLFFVMKAMGQSEAMAMSRSVLIGALALAYMIMYGHKMPGALNPRLGF